MKAGHFIVILSLTLCGLWVGSKVNAADANVTVLWQGGQGTFTTNVNFYVANVGESKTLSVAPQSGYRFKGPITVSPSGLTVSGSGGNYTVTIVSPNKQGSAQVTGKIEPNPSGGGGGPPPERPFDISVLQKWVYIYYSVPSNGTNIFAAIGYTNDLTSVVSLGDGSPASGTASWSSSLGGFTANNVDLAAGSASTKFVATGAPGSVGTIAVTGQNLKDSGNIPVPNATSNLTVKIAKVELLGFTGSGGSPSYNSSFGRLSLGGGMVAGMGLSSNVRVSNWDADSKLEYVQGIRRKYTLFYTNGSSATTYMAGSDSSFCLDTGDPYDSKNISGSGDFQFNATDSPYVDFDISLFASNGVYKIDFFDQFEMYVGYKLPSNQTRVALGVLNWGWSGTIAINVTNATSSLSSSSGPGNPTGTSSGSIPSYGCTY